MKFNIGDCVIVKYSSFTHLINCLGVVYKKSNFCEEYYVKLDSGIEIISDASDLKLVNTEEK